jgi:hypothetical protein
VLTCTHSDLGRLPTDLARSTCSPQSDAAGITASKSTYTHTHIYIYIYIYIYKHSHTHIYTNTHTDLGRLPTDLARSSCSPRSDAADQPPSIDHNWGPSCRCGGCVPGLLFFCCSYRVCVCVRVCEYVCLCVRLSDVSVDELWTAVSLFQERIRQTRAHTGTHTHTHGLTYSHKLTHTGTLTHTHKHTQAHCKLQSLLSYFPMAYTLCLLVC